MSFELNLQRVTAPLYVKAGSGINDDLSGIERPVSFNIKAMDEMKAEIVQSLAKWKRLMLANYHFQQGEGLYTDMNAIRADEDLDNTHSLYVDQWDWERVISLEERNLDFHENIVKKLYDVIRRTEKYICHQYNIINPILPDEITFIHSEELEQRYPELTPFEREKKFVRNLGQFF